MFNTHIQCREGFCATMVNFYNGSLLNLVWTSKYRKWVSETHIMTIFQQNYARRRIGDQISPWKAMFQLRAIEISTMSQRTWTERETCEISIIVIRCNRLFGVNNVEEEAGTQTENYPIRILATSHINKNTYPKGRS